MEQHEMFSITNNRFERIIKNIYNNDMGKHTLDLMHV